MDPFQVILGGGRRTFLPSGTRDEETKHLNKRLDRRNMIEVRYKMGSKLDYYELNAVFKSSALFGVCKEGRMTKCQFNMSESMLNKGCAMGVNTTDYIFFQAWKAEKRRRLSEHQYKYVNKLKDFKQVDPTKVDYLLGNALYD